MMKRFFLSALLSMALVFAPTTSLNTCGTAADQTGDGGATWTNPTNAQGANDGSYATTVPFLDAPLSDELKCTNFAFTSGQVPSGATINGIRVTIRNKSSSATISGSISQIFIVKGGTIQSTNLGPGSALTTSDRDDTYGSTSNLWGTTWTQSDILSSGFGVAFNYTNSASVGRTVSVDSVQIDVTYTAASGVTFHRTLQGVGQWKAPKRGAYLW